MNNGTGRSIRIQGMGSPTGAVCNYSEIFKAPSYIGSQGCNDGSNRLSLRVGGLTPLGGPGRGLINSLKMQ